MTKFSLILATDTKNGIGKKGNLAWNLSEDLKYFKYITTDTNKNDLKVNVVIMGKKTWESIPQKYKPLSRRLNIILSRDSKYTAKGAIVKNSIKDALKSVSNNIYIDKIFIIGGANIYNQVIDNIDLDKIYMTKILDDYKCDVFFKGISKHFTKISDSGVLKSKKNNIKYKFLVYQNSKN